MEQRDVLKINRQFLMLARQASSDPEAAELMTGVPKSLIDKIAMLDMDEIDEIAASLGVSLFTIRLSDVTFSRLLKMPPGARSTYAEATLVSNSRGGATFP